MKLNTLNIKVKKGQKYYIAKTAQKFANERARKTKDPKNVSQFCNYIRSIARTLNQKGIRINKLNLIKLSKQYKKTFSKKSFDKILKELK